MRKKGSGQGDKKGQLTHLYQGMTAAYIHLSYKACHYHTIPPLFIIITPVFVQFLMTVGQDKEFLQYDTLYNLIGNYLTWAAILIVFTWALIWLKIPSRKTYGPITYYNEKPEFQNNGFMYYTVTVFAFVLCQVLWKPLSKTIFWNMPLLVGSLNISAFVLCIYLFAKGMKKPEEPVEIERKPLLFLFYSGIELHPHLFHVQIKQLTNCRFGLILWQLLILAFFYTGYERYGLNYGSLVNCLLQTIYLAKFYWWEAGYFWTLDIAHDKAGYYICWGCMVFVPAFYTYSSYYLVLHPPIISDYWSIIIFLFGLFSIVMNYRVDYEKQSFQNNHFNDNFKLWGKKVKFISATYSNAEGHVIETRLLTSGCWGIARHLNYFFELLIALSWSLPGFGLGIHTFFYPIFMLYLLIHRCYRDEKRCKEKYGVAYLEYCNKVRYRIVPYIF
ncbi:uncharacterized protein LOC142327685 isoform X2 [Lycorma delicatula]|uniref:uncharacterized protein LOC142327685 isoform X2 n=1 Tax=Lycorma delicatula TaxID=130591 RepID=UPI003F51283A